MVRVQPGELKRPAKRPFVVAVAVGIVKTFAQLLAAGGALGSVETTVLMTVQETLEALAKGKDIGYRQPGESRAS